VGEQAGAQVEVLTVHKAKGLEYPILVVADLLSDRRPAPNVVVRHATAEGWLKIGSFEPAGWKEALEEEKRQQDAEERRLLYVALTRARDHLVIPCFPDQRRKAWLDAAIAGLDTSEVTWFDTRTLELGGEAPRRPRATTAIDGTDADARKALVRETEWEAERKRRRKTARQVAQRIVPATAKTPGEEEEETQPRAAAPAGSETDAELAPEGPLPAVEDSTPRSAQFGRLVHALLAQPIPSEADLETAAQALAPQYGLPSADATAAATLAARARTLPEIAAADTADLVYRELPFAVPLPDGTLATGQIDLAYRKDGEWTVIDFKTAHLGDASLAVRLHGPQLAVYRRAMAKLVGAPVRSTLSLLQSGDLTNLEPQMRTALG
jgi:ATP-dependent helicase/nuclease subunit A